MGRLTLATPLAAAVLLASFALATIHAPPAPGASDEAHDAIASACDPCAVVVDAAPTHNHWENMIAVSPLDPAHVVAASMFLDNASTDQTGIFVSRDGGRTWARGELPTGERAPLGHPLSLVNNVVDPAIAVASDGSVVFAGVGLTEVGARGTQAPVRDVLFVARSTDGGATFPIEGVRILEESQAPYQGFADMPRFATGPDGLLVLGWGSADLPATSASAAMRFLLTQNANEAASIEGRFSVSRDAGASWSAPRVAFRDGATLYYPAHPAILQDGSWIFMPSDNQDMAGGRVYLARSTDEGATWSWTDTGLVGLIQGTLAASRVDGRIYYSFLEPTGDLGWVVPSVAIGEGPQGPWRVVHLTDAPVRRMAIEDTVDVDAAGIAHVIYLVELPGQPRAQVRVASLAPDGSFTTTLVDTLDSAQGATHYFGLAALPQGAIATWNAGASPFALHAGVVR